MKIKQAAHASAFVPGSADEPACILVMGGLNENESPVQIYNLQLKKWSLADSNVIHTALGLVECDFVYRAIFRYHLCIKARHIHTQSLMLSLMSTV